MTEIELGETVILMMWLRELRSQTFSLYSATSFVTFVRRRLVFAQQLGFF